MDIVERFLNYTRINSTAVIGAGHLPSSPGQTALAKLLAGELRSLGLNVEEREHSIVVGTLPSNLDDATRKAPTIAWVAHLDTSNEYATDTNARIIDYRGGDIVLNEALEVVMRESAFPELKRYVGDRDHCH
ncbi:hypothetical protein N8E89_08020 [Phyllobacterium sp. A18/5-2]|uniref:hypothetical protein n=1 Tax=Phyllobacterium sp. A18/5-2 TaxID=2978392 RepID=UPI0021C5E181|nr:hypothetical protein [Phyllobacterium sp. A18/5-2]UXN65554.1 hypothetical protein N8E89_08020 [Phyllobacterium sp. A18/5-2]